MFPHFTEQHVATDRGPVFARVGGNGPPVLLLHGYPQTHLMWHAAADLLVRQYTVVVVDLPGYGASFRPVPAPDHAPHSKRAGRGVDASHFLVEDQPEQVADELHTLLGAAAAAPSTPSKGPS